MLDWHFITGEYPPQSGGVSDYNHTLAQALVAAGDRVHVWAPQSPGESHSSDSLLVHRLPGGFGLSGLRALTAGLAASPAPRRILLQYVPHGFGWKAMNVAFCRWIERQAAREPIWTIFHEIAFFDTDTWKHRILTAVSQRIARRIGNASQRVFVSTPAWSPLLRGLGVSGRELEWLPIPSSIPAASQPDAVPSIRAELARHGTDPSAIVGHFGTFGSLVWGVLRPVLTAILREMPHVVIHLIGRGSQRALADLADCPGVERVVAADDLSPEQVATHIAACDVMLQPFPDGINFRRTSALSAMKIGRAIVSCSGHNTEPLWSEQQLVALAASSAPSDYVSTIKRLLADDALGAAYAQRARAFYETTCALERIVAQLRQ